jgi:hypothetical protein
VTVGVVVTVVALIWLALNNGAGHGSGLPFNMFVAPGGFGALAWPIAFALCGLPRRWALMTLGGVCVVLCLHNVCAWSLYEIDQDSERVNMLSLAGHNPTMRAMMRIDLAGTYAVQAILVCYAVARVVWWRRARQSTSVGQP